MRQIDAINAFLNSKDIKQRQVAQDAEVSEAALSRLLRGHRCLEIEALQRLERALRDRGLEIDPWRLQLELLELRKSATPESAVA